MYNDSIFDLLEDGMPSLAGRTPLRLKEDAAGRVFVAGLSEVGRTSHVYRYLTELLDQEFE